jgi:hypothetical protein
MAFNANTYRANRHAKNAKAELSQARDIKARAAKGEAYEWELSRIATLARLAIISARLSRSYRASA